MTMRKTTRGLPWEEAAELRTNIVGWVCRTCGRFWGDGPAGERAARHCCASDAPCECGGRRSKGLAVCDDCREKRNAERYYALEEIDWDGETPLVDYDGEHYLFDVDDLVGFLDACEEEGDTNEESQESALHCVRLCLCKQQPPMHFDLDDLLSENGVDADDITGSLRADGLAAEKAINDWLGKFGPAWAQDKRRPSLASLRRHLGLPAVAEQKELE